jgi:hypothetical protein
MSGDGAVVDLTVISGVLALITLDILRAAVHERHIIATPVTQHNGFAERSPRHSR